ncbi:hypothetical protein SAMN04488115_11811 [Bosea lathyri]|uniref:Uncharacterized protein n=1 Tax=Bosea lathyri TaxID=1036778 RepID=A0A1H6D912_9HYPH|nr:hypothetical protein SAMN04488115_11811 [Bosea lathyri]
MQNQTVKTKTTGRRRQGRNKSSGTDLRSQVIEVIKSAPADDVRAELIQVAAEIRSERMKILEAKRSSWLKRKHDQRLRRNRRRIEKLYRVAALLGVYVGQSKRLSAATLVNRAADNAAARHGLKPEAVEIRSHGELRYISLRCASDLEALYAETPAGRLALIGVCAGASAKMLDRIRRARQPYRATLDSRDRVHGENENNEALRGAAA